MAEELYSFPPLVRLRKPFDYKKVFANPVKSADSYFTLLAINNELTHPRLGLAIAKKNIRLAVDRNYLKRTIRENFRMQQQQLGTMDIVVLARKEALDVSADVLRASLNKHWIRLLNRCNSL